MKNIHTKLKQEICVKHVCPPNDSLLDKYNTGLKNMYYKCMVSLF